MYIDYEKIGKILGFGKEFFYRLKLEQNLKYIAKNQKKVFEDLQNAFPLNVIFYVYDESKWKSQSVYDLMEKDERFNPIIVVTKNCAPEGNANFQTTENVRKCYEYFKSKGMKVAYGYQIPYEHNPLLQGNWEYYIPLEKFNPDIIIYSHPWYIYETQGPVVCSKFALTYYIPYFLPASEQWHEYKLRFHQYIYRHYVPTESVRDYYSKNMPAIEHSFRVVGHPILDCLSKQDNAEKKYIIYAPHWTVCGENLRFSTFKWSGEKMLEFAKNHTELNWVFRPHPLLYNFAITSGFVEGRFPPFEKDLEKGLRAGQKLLLAHYRAVKCYREMGLDGKIGAVNAIIPVYPASCSAEDIAAARRQAEVRFDWWAQPMVKGCYPQNLLEECPGYRNAMPEGYAEELRAAFVPVDFLGINYYVTSRSSDDPDALLRSRRVQTFYAQPGLKNDIYPAGLLDSLLYVRDRYDNIPVFITENGLCTPDSGDEETDCQDELRISYLREHFRMIYRAMLAGVDIRGYFYWNDADSYEQLTGYSQRFGLTWIDRHTGRRRWKKSRYYFQTIAQTHMVD